MTVCGRPVSKAMSKKTKKNIIIISMHSNCICPHLTRTHTITLSQCREPPHCQRRERVVSRHPIRMPVSCITKRHQSSTRKRNLQLLLSVCGQTTRRRIELFFFYHSLILLVDSGDSTLIKCQAFLVASQQTKNKQ